MSSTATMLEESIFATQQQKSAADQVSTAMVQIREAANQLAIEQEKRLATPKASTSSSGSSSTRSPATGMSAVHVRVRLGEESYAVAVENVIEVAELGTLSPVPGSDRAVLGVRNSRGEVLPVFDLASVLGIRSDSLPQCLLVTELGSLRAGFAIDEVTDVGELPPIGEETQSRLLAGAALDDSGLIGVIDVELLFAELTAAAA
jgi:purine-binding chemotaxis protein CheW